MFQKVLQWLFNNLRGALYSHCGHKVCQGCYHHSIHLLSTTYQILFLQEWTMKSMWAYYNNMCERPVTWSPVSWSHPSESVCVLDKKGSKVKWLHSRQMVKMAGKSPRSEVHFWTWQLPLQKNKNSFQSSSLQSITMHYHCRLQQRNYDTLSRTARQKPILCVRTTTAFGKTVSTSPGSKPPDYPFDIPVKIFS